MVLWSFVFLVIFVGLCSADPTVTLKTPFGTVLGNMLGDETTEFLGVHYAQPPVGDLRFSPPQLIKPWTDTKNATTYGPACVTAVYPIPPYMSEDCLHINIWGFTDTEDLVPVMVFIHGGFFAFGSNADGIYNGSHLSRSEKVVVVAMNYRLGFLGASAFGSESEDSVGILDQQMALRWIHMAIASFGGDPAMVTLWGQSAGGVSAYLHYMIPSSWPFFSRIMIHSGNTERISNHSDVVDLTLAFAETIDCSGTGREVKQCLRKLPADQLVAAATKWCNPPFSCFLPFTSPKGVLPLQPYEITDCKKFHGGPVYMGYDLNDTAIISGESLFSPPLNIPKVITYEMALGFLKNFYLVPQSRIDVIVKEYNYEFTLGNFTGLVDVFRDMWLTTQNLHFAEFATAKCGISLSYWINTYKPSIAPKFLPQKLFGVSHGEELTFVFGNPCWLTCSPGLEGPFDSDDKKAVKMYQSMWGDFAWNRNLGVQFPKIQFLYPDDITTTTSNQIFEEAHGTFWASYPWYWFR